MTCIICGRSDGWRLPQRNEPDVEAWRRAAGDSAERFWTLCATCGNAYPSSPPRPDVLDRIWRADRDTAKFGAGTDADAIWANRMRIGRLWAHRAYDLMAPLHAGPPGRFLDIACGLGETVRLFHDRGWQAAGIDIDAATLPFHKRLGIDTRIGRIEELGLDGVFDVIHIAHAIYFVSDPMAFLRRVRAHLAPGGLFAVVISDFLAATDPNYPAYFHTFYPVADSMRYALALADFEPVMTRALSGSILIAARPGRKAMPAVSPQAIRRAYATKPLRYRLIGRPNLAARAWAKRLLRRG